MPGPNPLTQPFLDSSTRDLLRARGLRATAPRLAVYGALQEMGGHPSADEVGAHLHAAGVPLARASIYNSLEALADSGVILRADAGPGAARYEVGPVWHHHFVCRSCKRVIDIDCLVGAKPCLEPESNLDLLVDEAQIIFRGLCPDCRH
ncbi:MAG: Fur family transcriptional regulator [Candidatus Dormibacteraeota bacterium]|nr:Fur family transcriptional regulator [Candidatus Dormibacteraeota bacterium]